MTKLIKKGLLAVSLVSILGTNALASNYTVNFDRLNKEQKDIIVKLLNPTSKSCERQYNKVLSYYNKIKEFTRKAHLGYSANDVYVVYLDNKMLIKLGKDIENHCDEFIVNDLINTKNVYNAVVEALENNVILEAEIKKISQ